MHPCGLISLIPSSLYVRKAGGQNLKKGGVLHKWIPRKTYQHDDHY